MIKVSVITTVYNGERYFDRAIPSILNQTYKDFEWVIINDGSSDRTQELLDKIANQDQRLRVFNFGRLGRATALNRAVELARGQYIFNQDFDDISYSDRIQKQLEFLETHSEVGLVGCYYVVVDEIRGERYIRRPPTEHDQLVRAMARCIPFAHTLVAFRKEAWAQVGGYPIVTNIVDLRLWIKFAKAGWKLANIPEVLGEHFVHAESFWHKHFAYAKRQRELAAVQLSAIRELGLPKWMVLYPVGRFVYPYLPTSLKRIVRRTIGGSQEDDI